MLGINQAPRTAPAEDDGSDHIGLETPGSGVATPQPDLQDKRQPGIMTYFGQVRQDPSASETRSTITRPLPTALPACAQHVGPPAPLPPHLISPAEGSLSRRLQSAAHRPSASLCQGLDAQPRAAHHGQGASQPCPTPPASQSSSTTSASASAFTSASSASSSSPSSSSAASLSREESSSKRKDPPALDTDHLASSQTLPHRPRSVTTPLELPCQAPQSAATSLSELVHSASGSDHAPPPPPCPPKDRPALSHPSTARQASSKWFSLDGIKELTRGVIFKSGPPTPTRALSSARPSSLDGREASSRKSNESVEPGSGTQTPRGANGAQVPTTKGRLTVKIAEARGLRRCRDPYVVAVFQRSELISSGPRSMGDAESAHTAPSAVGGIAIQRQGSDSGRPPMAIPMRSRQSSNTSVTDYNTFRSRTTHASFTNPKWDAEAVLYVTPLPRTLLFPSFYHPFVCRSKNKKG